MWNGTSAKLPPQRLTSNNHKTECSGVISRETRECVARECLLEQVNSFTGTF